MHSGLRHPPKKERKQSHGVREREVQWGMLLQGRCADPLIVYVSIPLSKELQLELDCS